MGLNRRILVVRACAIGDFVLNLPALVAIAHQNPDARFTLVGYPDILSLAKRFIPIEGIHSIESPPWSTLFNRSISYLNFDLAWVWMKDPVVANHLRESGVRNVLHAAAFADGVHAADHLLASVGGPPPDLPDLWMKGSARVILHPGSGSPAKCWPWFKELADEIPDAVVMTGPCETPFQTDRPFLEGLSLEAAADEIRTCHAFIGNDSGMTHLAAYWGCPTIALFGPTDPRVWGPVGRRVTIISRTPIGNISVKEIRNLL